MIFSELLLSTVRHGQDWELVSAVESVDFLCSELLSGFVCVFGQCWSGGRIIW